MITWYDVIVQRQYRMDQREKANRWRQVHQMSQREATLLHSLLARLGGRLVMWGWRLQAKYGTLTELSKSVRYAKVLRQQYAAPSVSVCRK
jgi:hypothetical protein